MAEFDDFLTQLLKQGTIVFRAVPAPQARMSPRGVAILSAGFESHRLSVGGPGIAFDASVAWAAAELVRESSWATVNRDRSVADLKKRLKMPGAPETASHHLSADLMLRYIPQIMRRARGLDSRDPLVGLLANILRRWPISGVLSDVDEGPIAPLHFGGHPGLLMLYAERLIDHDRAAWRPSPPGLEWDYYELVIQERGPRMPAPGKIAVAP